ncbi:Ornithine decarboxylase [Morus notabilis]|uniref:ornithine decarboxylase n=1 Tax=Morus notabilis TaxID=981085 RepID=W9S4H4_9ROSA|nr:ornithine decarboxylase [Morus notabilis]EXC25434.1 Ornithine decarboxylase [Morus notabilis]
MESDPKSLQAVMEAPTLSGKVITVFPKDDGFNNFIKSVILKNEVQNTKQPFYVLHLGAVANLMDQWVHSLPEVRPFYAVKCNPDPTLLAAMAALGSGFDCGSRAEIESVLSLGSVGPDRIIFSNPCKMESHIKYAATVGVNLTTFDSLDEVEKIRKWHPQSSLLIRLKSPEDARVQRQASDSKFGALPEEVVPLLRAAQAAQIPVVGVSFHVGTAVKNFRAYAAAIEAAKAAFELATRLGMPQMRVLNIGGGFTAGQGSFEEAASMVRAAIHTYFPDAEPRLNLMAEPGRFFAESAFTLATNIIGKRVRGEAREYWINDGIHGSLAGEVALECGNGNLSRCMPLAGTSKEVFSSTVYGPTCNSLDIVLKGYWLPELVVDDWLIFPNMGAYSSAFKSSFNGFNTSLFSTYVVTDAGSFSSTE